VSPLELHAAALLSTASEIAAGLGPPLPGTVELPGWPALPPHSGWKGALVTRETAKRTARVAVYLLVAPHLLGVASAVIGRADRPSLAPVTVTPAASANQNAPVPTMTDSGVNYGG
jgi:hypothetical protein